LSGVRRGVIDSGRNLARGVEFIDTETGKSYEAFAKTVVLGAGAMESTRILFNSSTREYPAGLANSSGVLGHFLMDSVKSGFIQGWFPGLKGRPVTNDDGAGGGHLYIPRFQNVNGGRKSEVIGGWHFQPNSGSDWVPGYSCRIAGFGSEFKS